MFSSVWVSLSKHITIISESLRSPFPKNSPSSSPTTNQNKNKKNEKQGKGNSRSEKTEEKNKSKEKDVKEEKVKKNKIKTQDKTNSPSTSKNDTPETTRKSKPFTSLMDDVVFVMSGYQNPERSNLRDKLVEMGAQYKSDWNPGCTHLM